MNSYVRLQQMPSANKFSLVTFSLTFCLTYVVSGVLAIEIICIVGCTKN